MSAPVHVGATNIPLASAGQHMAVVVAHPDDETFGCGSLIAHATTAGATVTVICATRGESGERRPEPTTDAWPLGFLREVELCQAALILGVSDVVVLDHVDSGFAGDPPDRALISVPHDDLVADLAIRLGELAPDVVLTLDGSDGHRDHIHVRDAVTSAVARLDRRPRVVYSSLARSLMQAWAESVAASNPDSVYLDVAVLGRPDHELTAIDTSSVVDLRERAIACHRSQVSPFEQLPPDLRRAFLTVDHIVEPGATEPCT